jgi:hypothetical protein
MLSKKLLTICHPFTKGALMVRLILIGVGVVSTAIAGYVAKRKLFRPKVDEFPAELRIYRPAPRPRRRRARCSPLDHGLDNGEHDPSSAS